MSEYKRQMIRDLFSENECEQYNTTDIELNNMSHTIPCENGWIYETERGETSIVTEFDLVCSNAWIKPFTTSMYLLGVLLGSFFGGTISDRFGRKKLVLISLFMASLMRVLCGVAQSPIMFSIAFFLCGTFAIMQYITGFLLITESVSSSKRALAGTTCACGFAVGYMILPALAYLIPNWRWLCVTIAIIGMAEVPVLWRFLSESPLWLTASGRNVEAQKIFAKMYEISDGNLELKNMLPKTLKDGKEEMSLKSLLMLLSIPSFRTRSLVLYAVWFTSAMTYYCISLATSDMGGNKYINCLVAAAVEIPAYFFSFFLIEKIGRRSMMFISFLFTGLACSIAPFAGQIASIGVVVCAMTAKFIISGIFSVAYIYTSELFPTLLRNSSVGITSTVSRFGGILAPYLIFAGETASQSVPYLIMGGFCVLTAFLCLLLPETKTVSLPNTTEDAIELDKFKMKLVCCRQ